MQGQNAGLLCFEGGTAAQKVGLDTKQRLYVGGVVVRHRWLWSASGQLVAFVKYCRPLFGKQHAKGQASIKKFLHKDFFKFFPN